MCHEQFWPNNCKPFCPFFMQHSSAVIFCPKTPLPPCCLENCFKSHSVCFLKICKDKWSLIEEIRCCYRKIANSLYFGLRLSMLWIYFPLCRLYQRKWLWVRKVEALWKTCLFSTYNRNARITTWRQTVPSVCICSCKNSGGKNLS